MAGTATKKPPKDEAEVLAKIASMPAPHRAVAERLHELIVAANPELRPRIWYGMPGYAKTGPVLCFFRLDDGFMTLGLTEKAKHAPEDGAKDRLMASAWFLNGLDEATEARIATIIKRATA